ncbi:hypothetical protein [Serratia fonticola]|uniref:hypothetical protein n=1 Tax=Serratia fonticola TaxID=47917 RepID=UPI0021BB847D|nr:hypothetical protein [Serratia fonticola]
MFLSIIIVFTSFLTIIYGKYDFSFTLRFLFQVVYLLFAILVTSVIYYIGLRKKKENFVELCILNAFLLQALIILTAFVSPTVRDIIQLFQDDATVQIAAQYSGIRGLALAGAQFFGLSVGFSIALILSTFLYVNNKISTLRYVSYFILFTVSIFFVGRSGLLGSAISLLYLIVALAYDNKIKRVVKFLAFLSGTIAIGCVLFYLLAPVAVKDSVFNYLLPFAFEFIYNYLNKGTFATTSTNTLEGMYFTINEITLLLGDGVYTNADNTYYMHTDAGYMRVILFGGIVSMILMFSYQLYLVNCIRKYFEYFHYNGRNLFYIFMVVSLLIFQYKGEVIGFLAIMQIIFFILLSTLCLRFKRTPMEDKE